MALRRGNDGNLRYTCQAFGRRSAPKTSSVACFSGLCLHPSRCIPGHEKEDEWCGYDQNDHVHLFQIPRFFQWSKSSHMLLFYRLDTSCIASIGNNVLFHPRLFFCPMSLVHRPAEILGHLPMIETRTKIARSSFGTQSTEK